MRKGRWGGVSCGSFFVSPLFMWLISNDNRQVRKRIRKVRWGEGVIFLFRSWWSKEEWMYFSLFACFLCFLCFHACLEVCYFVCFFYSLCGDLCVCISMCLFHVLLFCYDCVVGKLFCVCFRLFLLLFPCFREYIFYCHCLEVITHCINFACVSQKFGLWASDEALSNVS